MLSALKKSWRILRSVGPEALYRRVLWQAHLFRWNRTYREWAGKFDTVTAEDRRRMADEIARFADKPLISVLMPVYNVDEIWLRKAIDCVIDQVYPCWELCIADDHSPKPHIRKVLEEYAERDERIKVVYRTENGHISAASNSALELVAGEYTALLDHDDELTPNALFEVAKAVNQQNADMLYSDEDLIDSRGKRSFPKFKPDWSPDLFCSMNLVTHLSVYRTSILKKIGGFRLGVEGSQDYDLALRFIEQIPAANIVHIPKVLYHWRAIQGSVALGSEEKPYAHARARQAIADHFQRNGVEARSIAGFAELHRAVYGLPEPRPLVSIIVASDARHLDRFTGLLSRASYGPFELILAGPGAIVKSESDGTVKSYECHESSFYSLLNSAADKASGTVLCFLDASSTEGSERWLEEIVSIAVQKGVGGVAPRVIFPNRRIKHAGLIMGVGVGVGRAHFGFHKYDLGNFMRLQVTQNFSALTAECLAIRKDLFDQTSGFDAKTFPAACGDVDLGLRLAEQGYRNVWTPWAEVVQTGKPASFGSLEIGKLRERWPKYFERDPFYSLNFSDEDAGFRMAFPPRAIK